MFRNPGLWSGRLWAGLKVGILGGSFNPAHEGHRHVGLLAIAHLDLDAVWWLVSPQNPLKPAAGMAPFAARLARAQAVARHPRFVVTDLEDLLGEKYTARTLEKLRARFPRTRFVWMMGADNLAQIHGWHRWDDILKTTPVAVWDRPSYSLKGLHGRAANRFAAYRVGWRGAGRLASMAPPAWTFMHSRLHPASATAIRRAWPQSVGGVDGDARRNQ